MKKEGISMRNRAIRTTYLIITDILLINISICLAFYLRFDSHIPEQYFRVYIDNIIILSIIKTGIFFFYRLYKSLWRYASIEELGQIIIGTAAANAATIIYTIMEGNHLPRSIYIIVFMLDILLIGGNRLSYRVLRRLKNGNLKLDSNEKRVLIVGAGDAGAMVIKELKNHTQLNSKPVAIAPAWSTS